MALKSTVVSSKVENYCWACLDNPRVFLVHLLPRHLQDFKGDVAPGFSNCIYGVGILLADTSIGTIQYNAVTIVFFSFLFEKCKWFVLVPWTTDEAWHVLKTRLTFCFLAIKHSWHFVFSHKTWLRFHFISLWQKRLNVLNVYNIKNDYVFNFTVTKAIRCPICVQHQKEPLCFEASSKLYTDQEFEDLYN